MSWITRVLSCALTAAAVLLAALFLTHSGAGCYDRGRTTPYRAVAEEAERLEKLERERAEIFAAIRRRAEVRDAVIEGRCPLPEAAAHFWELNRGMPGFKWDLFRQFYPGATEGERCCRHVIRHVACHLEDRPGRGEAVVRRLEAELAECLRRGPIRLPGVDEAPAP